MTHFWPDYTGLITELRNLEHTQIPAHPWASHIRNIASRAADALEAERRVRAEEYAIAKHLRAKARKEAIRECIEVVQAHEGHIKTKDCVSCILDQLTSKAEEP